MYAIITELKLRAFRGFSRNAQKGLPTGAK